jgi:hypothetical protein
MARGLTGSRRAARTISGSLVCWHLAPGWPKLPGGGDGRMKLLSHVEDQVELRLSVDELMLMRNALHEICNGMQFTDNDFLAILDTQRATAQDLLLRVNKTLDRLNLLSH